MPLLITVDPYAIQEMPAELMARLLDDISKILPVANEGPERRGLRRLQVLAEACGRNPDWRLVWIGD